jgi:hypothetical protein
MENKMKKVTVILGGLALAGCGAGAVTTVTSVFDQIQQTARTVCGYTFAFATIDAIIKALGGPPVVETIAGLLCTQAQQLQAQRAPKASVTTSGQRALDLGVVVINGKPVRIQVLQ